MTVQPTRDQLRALAATVLDDGHYLGDEEEVEMAQGVRHLLDQLDQAEAELDSWMARAYEAEKRAWRAEKRIKAVRDVLDRAEATINRHPAYTHGGQRMHPIVSGADIRRALESVTPPGQ